MGHTVLAHSAEMFYIESAELAIEVDVIGTIFDLSAGEAPAACDDIIEM